MGAIEEYKEVSERYEFLKEQTDDIEKSKSELNKIIEDLTASMSEKFMAQFNRINAEFKTCFADFFGGGKGEILLDDPSNCLESQIEIKIQPPGKSVQNINLFSGGENRLPQWHCFSACSRLLLRRFVFMTRLRRRLMMLMLSASQNICAE